jgi:hypothetical protein
MNRVGLNCPPPPPLILSTITINIVGILIQQVERERRKRDGCNNLEVS